MTILEVNSRKLARDFLIMPLSLYKDDRNYVRPLDKDINLVFDRHKNVLFKSGDCCRWLLTNHEGNYIGRIAAFYDEATTINNKQRTGGCGFFECIDDSEAATLLFSTARNWLQERGLEAMDGPINFGSRERWWGLLVAGYHPPCYCCNYNPVYYQHLFEQYGFKLYYKQYTYIRSLSKSIRTAYLEKAQRILNAKGYSFSAVKPGDMRQAAEDFRAVYNKAWLKHAGVGEITEAEAEKLMRTLKPVLDPRTLWFAYHEEKPVGFFISIPDVNELFVKYANGKIGLKALFMLFYNKYFQRCRTLFGIVFGVIPEHQRKGVEVAMIASFKSFLEKEPKGGGYQELQMNWIGDFNPKMMNLARQIDADVYKTHHTYRFLFDETKEVERHPII